MTHMNASTKEPNITIYFFFPPITRWCSISDVLFTVYYLTLIGALVATQAMLRRLTSRRCIIIIIITGGRGVSDFCVL